MTARLEAVSNGDTTDYHIVIDGLAGLGAGRKSGGGGGGGGGGKSAVDKLLEEQER